MTFEEAKAMVADKDVRLNMIMAGQEPDLMRVLVDEIEILRREVERLTLASDMHSRNIMALNDRPA